MDQQQPIGDSFSIGRSIANGFRAIRVAAGPMWVAGLLMSISEGCPGGPPDELVELFRSDEQRGAWSALGSRLPMLAGPSADPDWSEFGGLAIGLVIAIVLAGLVFGLAMFALHCFMQTGFIRMHEQILRESTDRFGPLFSGKDRFWHMAGWKLLSWLAIAATVLATAWPGALLAYFGYARDHQALMAGGVGLAGLLVVPALVYVALGVYLGELAVALEGASPVVAFRRSWSLARGNRLPLFAFAVLCFLLQIASYVGLLLCCVGALVTVPFGRSLYGFAKTEGYLLFTRGPGESKHWRLWQRDASEERVQPVPGWGLPAPAPPPQTPAQHPADEPPPDWPPRGPGDPNKT